MASKRYYHIGFGRHDLGQTPARIALVCGDPQRTRRIARETAGVKCLQTLSENRGLHSYLCALDNGRTFVAATSGMGAPSLSIVVNELVGVGIRTMIRVGTCGALTDQVKAGSVVISQAALCRQGAANDIAPVEYPAAADPFLTVALVEAARRLKIEHPRSDRQRRQFLRGAGTQRLGQPLPAAQAAGNQRGVPAAEHPQLRNGGRHPVQDGAGLRLCRRLCLRGTGRAAERRRGAAGTEATGGAGRGASGAAGGGTAGAWTLTQAGGAYGGDHRILQPVRV